MDSCYWCSKKGLVVPYEYKGMNLLFHERCINFVEGKHYIPVPKKVRAPKPVSQRKLLREASMGPILAPQCICKATKLYPIECPYRNMPPFAEAYPGDRNNDAQSTDNVRVTHQPGGNFLANDEALR